MPKTPISYYGGKLNLLKEILPLIPKHRIYTESFFGGGAVFFAKEPVESEIINDTNGMVMNFYEVVKSNFEELKLRVESTLFARDAYTIAWTVYRMPHHFKDKVFQAWAFFVATNMGFSCKIGSWGYDKYGKRPKAFWNKKIQFDEKIARRLEQVQIENNDACKVITSRDAEDAFHYVDPPYINSNQGHYGGYSQDDYINLLKTLTKVKGKFLLSSYPSDLLELYTKEFGWHTKTFEKPLSASNGAIQKVRKRKVEVLTANYPI